MVYSLNVKKIYIQKYKEFEWWQNLTGLVLEEDRFKAFYQLAINDYFGVYENGKSKRKRVFYNRCYIR